MPRVVSFDDACSVVDLRSLLPAFDEDCEVVMLDPGTYPASGLELDTYSYVVDGDLRIDGDIVSANESGFLVVRGDLHVRNLLVGGPIIHVSGSLNAEHAIHTDYNHGELIVRGNVRASVVVAEHQFEVGGRIDCPTTIDLGGLRVSMPGFAATLTQAQATREAKTYFLPEVLNVGGYLDGPALAHVLSEGRDPLVRRPG